VDGLRALAGTLSRLGRHHEVAVLVGALAADPRSSQVFGADSARLDDAEAAARAVLGQEFAVCRTQGAALGDAGAVAIARRLTRSVL
jgi:hypothetical protein